MFVSVLTLGPQLILEYIFLSQTSLHTIHIGTMQILLLCFVSPHFSSISKLDQDRYLSEQSEHYFPSKVVLLLYETVLTCFLYYSVLRETEELMRRYATAS